MIQNPGGNRPVPLKQKHSTEDEQKYNHFCYGKLLLTLLKIIFYISPILDVKNVQMCSIFLQCCSSTNLLTFLGRILKTENNTKSLLVHHSFI